MICLTSSCPKTVERLKQWFSYMSGLIPTKQENGVFYFEPKENSTIVTRERIFSFLQRDMHFLEILDFSIQEK